MLDQAEGLRALAGKHENNMNFYTRDKDINRHLRIITVTSGKGGVGKSNFVVNMAIALQKMGKNTLIFDADMGMGNDDVLMGFLPKYSVYDIIFNNKAIEDVLITGPYGVKLLPGGSGLNKIEDMTDNQRDNFLKKLSSLKNLDFILMDTGAGVNRSVLGFVAICDELVVITTPEPTSLTDAYSLLKAINHFNIKKAAKVVVNKIINKDEGQITFNKFNNAVRSFLKMDLEYLGKITEDRKLIEAVRKQQPFIISSPNCSAAIDIEEIALKLIGSEAKPSLDGIQGLFSKLFKIFS